MTVFQDHVDLAVSLVAVAPSPGTSGTSLEVSAGEGVEFPVPPFDLTLAPPDAVATFANSEVALVTAVVGDVFTVTRAQYGTSARDVQVGDRAVATITANHMQTVEQAIAALEAAAGVGPWTPYVPTWTAVSALVQPDIGDGTLVGRFTQVGFTTHYVVILTVGTTTVFGTVDDPSLYRYQFTLPVDATQSFAPAGMWVGLDTIPATVPYFTAGIMYIADDPTLVEGLGVSGPGAFLDSDLMATSTGARLILTGTYEAATGSGGGGSGLTYQDVYNDLDSGISTIPRSFCQSENCTVGGFGVMPLSYFTSTRALTSTQITGYVGGAPGAGTATLARAGLYEIDGVGAGTLVASTANDVTWMQVFGPETRAWQVPVNLTAGQRYAIGLLWVDENVPQMCGSSAGQNQGVIQAAPPRIGGRLFGLTDLPASFVEADLTPNENAFGINAGLVYMVLD